MERQKKTCFLADCYGSLPKILPLEFEWLYIVEIVFFQASAFTALSARLIVFLHLGSNILLFIEATDKIVIILIIVLKFS